MLDLNAGLTQVLADGTNTYLYGLERIAQYVGTTPSYFLGDALNSVRQLTDASGAVTLAKTYKPFGEVLSSTGSGASVFGFDGESTDTTGLQYLRARYYSSSIGRFVSRDTWGGDSKIPMSYNAWVFGYANPIFNTDPSGLYPNGIDHTEPGKWDRYGAILNINFKKGEGINDWNNSINDPEAWAVISAIMMVGDSFSRFLNLDPITSFRKVFGYIEFELGGISGDFYGYVENAHWIKIAPRKIRESSGAWVIDPGTYPLVRLVTHEMGHVFSTRIEDSIREMQRKIPTPLHKLHMSISPEQQLQNKGIYTTGGIFITGDNANGGYNRNGNRELISAYLDGDYYRIVPTDCIDENGKVGKKDIYHYTPYQWHPKSMDGGNTAAEDFADIFQNWVFSSFAHNESGNGINDWMNKWMPVWMQVAINHGP